MRLMLTKFGVVAAAAGGLNILFLVLFGWRNGPTVMAITFLYLPIAVIACGALGLVSGASPRAPAVVGILCGLLPLAFVALMYLAFSCGNASFVFK